MARFANMPEPEYHEDKDYVKSVKQASIFDNSRYEVKPLDTGHIPPVNLLNSAERYYIANEVVTRLEAINTDLFILAWQVRTLSWNDLWFSLDPEGWATVMSGKNIIGGIVADWNRGYLTSW